MDTIFIKTFRLKICKFFTILSSVSENVSKALLHLLVEKLIPYLSYLLLNYIAKLNDNIAIKLILI